MATDKPRFSITIPDDMLAQVEQYQAEHKINTKSKAIQRLIEIGLEEQSEDIEGRDIARRYNALDDLGKKVVDAVMQIEAERIPQKETVIIDLGTIRHYLYSPAAGPDGMVSGADYEDIPRTADMPKNADFCLTVSGDSMEPYLHDGQMIFISEDAGLQDMDVGVFFYHGGIYVKQYAPSYDESIYLLSANPEREAANITVPKECVQDLVCFGKVILKKKLPPPIYR